MSAFKKEHILEELRARVSDFFGRESNATSLITVTRSRPLRRFENSYYQSICFS
jgi:hypothetical protein